MRFLVAFAFLFSLSCFAASNQYIVPSHEEIQAPTDQKTEKCQTLLNDQIIISQAVANGVERARLEALAKRASNIDDDRKDKIFKLIDEAYSAPDPTDWLNEYWTACMESK